MVEIPLSDHSKKEIPIIIHREFHDEQNMKRIHTSQAYKQVHNVRVVKTQEVEKETKIPYRVPLDRVQP